MPRFTFCYFIGRRSIASRLSQTCKFRVGMSRVWKYRGFLQMFLQSYLTSRTSDSIKSDQMSYDTHCYEWNMGNGNGKLCG